LLSAADEVDDLYPVAVRERGVRPVGAAHDRSIKLYGEALRCERQLRNELVEHQAIGYLLLLAIDFDLQNFARLLQEG
jgi:hypothetical protein